MHDENARNIIDDSIDLEVLAQGFEIAEGLLWVASKKMFLFSDVKGNEIYSWTDEDGLNTFLSSGGHTEIVPYFEGGVLGSNGLALDLDGNLIICQHGDRRLAKLSFDNVSQEGVSAVVEKFELKYVRSTRVDELCVRAPVMLGTMDRTTFWLSMSFSCDLDPVPVKFNCNVPLASDAIAWMPVPTVTVEGFHNVSSVMELDPDTVRGAATFI